MCKAKDGELYKTVTLHGISFELRYGYYEEFERATGEPIPIYPDFIAEPAYTDDGAPFVTMVQDACERYKGKLARTPDTTCADCRYFERCEDWIGICTYRRKDNRI